MLQKLAPLLEPLPALALAPRCVPGCALLPLDLRLDVLHKIELIITYSHLYYNITLII